MPLSDIVNVVITRQTQTVTEEGFGTPLILGNSLNFSERLRFYASLDEVALDFSTSSKEYIAAQDIFSQEISPPLIAIGRRQVDSATIEVVTAMNGEDYTVVINGEEVTVPGTSTNTYSVATLNNDLVAGNRIAVSVQTTGANILGTDLSVIDFNSDFVTLNSIVPTVNGTPLSAVIFDTDQATTIQLVADEIASAANVTRAVVTGPRQITVVFDDQNTNVVNSVVTTLGASQPTATINDEIGFLFDASHLNTMLNIATAIEALPTIQSSTVSGPTNRILTALGDPNVTVVINSFVVSGGASQATATINNPLQPTTPENIADDLATAINSQLVGEFTANAPGDGTVTITTDTPGVGFTLSVRTTIVNPSNARVVITQVEPNLTYTISLNAIPFSFTVPPNIQTTQQIADVLADLINTIPQTVNVTATSNPDGTIDIVSNVPNETFSISVTSGIMAVDKGLLIEPLIASDSITDDLIAVNNADSSWYALIYTGRDVQEVKDIAAWVETQVKLFGTASDDPLIINSPAGTDTTSIAAFFAQQGYIRTFVMYHQDADYDFPEAAWFGRVLPLEPGSETWKFKTLNGISYSNLTTNQSRTALAKNANTYEFVAGVGITQNGTVAQGEFIDIVRGIDWLTARIKEYVFSVLVTNNKIPYTDAGIATIQAQVLRVMQLGIDNTFLTDDPAPVVTVPRAADVPLVDKANRILRNVKFTATLAGAIHAVRITGTVSV